MRIAGSGLRQADCGKRIAGSGLREADCGKRIAASGLRLAPFSKILPHNAKGPLLSGPRRICCDRASTLAVALVGPFRGRRVAFLEMLLGLLDLPLAHTHAFMPLGG